LIPQPVFLLFVKSGLFPFFPASRWIRNPFFPSGHAFETPPCARATAPSKPSPSVQQIAFPFSPSFETIELYPFFVREDRRVSHPLLSPFPEAAASFFPFLLRRWRALPRSIETLSSFWFESIFSAPKNPGPLPLPPLTPPFLYPGFLSGNETAIPFSTTGILPFPPPPPLDDGNNSSLGHPPPFSHEAFFPLSEYPQKTFLKSVVDASILEVFACLGIFFSLLPVIFFRHLFFSSVRCPLSIAPPPFPKSLFLCGPLSFLQIPPFLSGVLMAALFSPHISPHQFFFLT